MSFDGDVCVHCMKLQKLNARALIHSAVYVGICGTMVRRRHTAHWLCPCMCYKRLIKISLSFTSFCMHYELGAYTLYAIRSHRQRSRCSYDYSAYTSHAISHTSYIISLGWRSTSHTSRTCVHLAHISSHRSRTLREVCAAHAYRSRTFSTISRWICVAHRTLLVKSVRYAYISHISRTIRVQIFQ